MYLCGTKVDDQTTDGGNVYQQILKTESAPLYRHWGSAQAVRPIGGE
jgi:hypothetical protein